MAVIIDCSEKRKNSKGQLVKTVCKNYHSRKHKKQRNKYNTARKKYQNHKNKGKKKMPAPPPVIPPPIQAAVQGAKIKKRIATTLGAVAPVAMNSAAAGQKTFQNALNRIESRARNEKGSDKNGKFGFVSIPHKENYGTGKLRYDPRTGLVVAKNLSKKYKQEYE